MNLEQKDVDLKLILGIIYIILPSYILLNVLNKEYGKPDNISEPSPGFTLAMHNTTIAFMVPLILIGIFYIITKLVEKFQINKDNKINLRENKLYKIFLIIFLVNFLTFDIYFLDNLVIFNINRQQYLIFYSICLIIFKGIFILYIVKLENYFSNVIKIHNPKILYLIINSFIVISLFILILIFCYIGVIYPLIPMYE